ncbi:MULTISPECIES: RidA family protein [Achromobacter]|uniref:RidA family protein n=1 Tax=Achromobacter TaxID=222 RepID=UPI001EF270E0|nr:RidA family protein [Achromobacter sp. ACRQX]MCG7324557.1 RidA family protein [Achromobacter sp. ACRQX]
MSATTISGRLAELGLALPTVNPPRGSYVPAVRAGDLLFVAGQAPRRNGVLEFSGRVGRDLSVEQGRDAAALCALNVLGHLAQACGDDLARVAGSVRLAGVVNCAEDFDAHSKVLDGASDLLTAVLGERGLHARIATGASSLPSGMAVEVEAIFQLKP